MKVKSEVLIVGSGIAGLFAAIRLAESGKRVTILTKQRADEGATRYAQGGIASVWSDEDSADLHYEDTIRAGGGLCRAESVRACVEEGPQRVKELIDWGVEFTRRSEDFGGGYDLHKEGGHQKRRILHSGDLTGFEIERALLARVRSHQNVSLLEDHLVIDLITEGRLRGMRNHPGRVLGAYVLNSEGRVITVLAQFVILASGGAGKVYLYTSNPDTATGDGVAIAYRAGARVSNMEFFQFHPTCLYHPNERTFLLSEALRGEGAELVDLHGRGFMDRYHERGSLAPRDVVARAIDSEMKRTGEKHVYLDATRIGAEKLEKGFPNITKFCRRLGMDPARDPLPVVPAAHYMCGGVWVDVYGGTTIEGLYAIGEVSCTGLHGANRLASNSLLEGIVYADRAVGHILNAEEKISSDDHLIPDQIPGWDSGRAVAIEEQIDIAAWWLEIRTLMWNYVGIVRSNRRLDRARSRLRQIGKEITDFYWRFLVSKELIELRNLQLTAELIVDSASSRLESRGLHFNRDYPFEGGKRFQQETHLSR